ICRPRRAPAQRRTAPLAPIRRRNRLDKAAMRPFVSALEPHLWSQLSRAFLGSGTSITHCTSQGQREHHDHREGQQRPNIPTSRQEGGRANDPHHPSRDGPIVANDEVVPEASEPTNALHAVLVSSVGAAVRRNHLVSPSDASATNAMTATSDASLPGHARPAPSPLQKIPNAVSITPTPNFSVFSGTRESGAWTAAPTTSTATSAIAAPAAARPTWCCAPPNVMTMKATSR